MRLLIFGATGGTGRELVSAALRRGHFVDAFVRSPEKVTQQDARLRIVPGDVRDPSVIRSAIEGHDAVLSALGVRTLGRNTLLSDAAREIVAAMRASGIRRLIWESSLGVGQTRGQLGPLYNWLLIPFMLRHIFADKQRQESIIRASDIDWTIVQPGALTNGPMTGRYHAGPDASPCGIFPRISRADVADFMLNEVERPAHIRQVVALCYGS